MTYNKSLQGRFVSSRLTSPVLVGVSLLIWLVGIFFDSNDGATLLFGFEAGRVLQNVISLFCFAVSSLIVSSCYLFERRVKWFFPLTFALAAVSLFVHTGVATSLSLLLFAVLLSNMFSCLQGEDNRSRLFSIAALYGIALLFLPCFIILLPVFVYYVATSGVARTREMLSLLLGLVTPFWFQWGITYIYPQASELFNPINAPLQYILSARVVLPPMFNSLTAIIDIMVVVPFMTILSGSAVPGKPFLRKRLLFVALLDISLLVASFIYQDNFNIYYAWALPLKGVMMAYIFHLPVTKFSRYYFIIINIMWLLLVPANLWLRH